MGDSNPNASRKATRNCIIQAVHIIIVYQYSSALQTSGQCETRSRVRRSSPPAADCARVKFVLTIVLIPPQTRKYQICAVARTYAAYPHAPGNLPFNATHCTKLVASISEHCIDMSMRENGARSRCKLAMYN